MKARVKMKAARRDPLKEAKDTITFAADFTRTVTGPATLLAVAHSEMLSSVVFVSSSRDSRSPFIRLCHMTGCIPNCLKGKPSSTLSASASSGTGGSQMTLGAWIKQFSGGTTTISQFR
jgi:hypothetical protein